MKLKNFHRITAETPPEIEKRVSDWMDKLDEEHKNAPSSDTGRAVVWGIMNTPLIDKVVNRKEE